MELVSTILAGLVLAAVGPVLHRWLGDALGWILALFPALATGQLIRHVPAIARGEVIAEAYAWVPVLGIDLAFRLDGLSLALSLLVSVVGTFVLLYAGAYLAGDDRLPRVLGLLLAFLAAMLGLLWADDAISLFVFWELTSLTSYALIGTYHERESSRKAALTALVVTATGGLALLAGLILLGQVAGTFRLSAMQAMAGGVLASPVYPAVVALVFAGALTKSAQAPFSFWLPSAMAAPTPVSAYLHSATMVNAGVYLLLRLTPVLGGTRTWSVPLVTLGGITMLAGGVLALFQRDLKLVLAHSTVSVLGTLTLLAGLGTTAAVKGAVVLLLAHGLYKASLFMVAGAIDHATGTREIDQLGGLRSVMPATATVALGAAVSLAGLGPLFSFVGKELFFEALLTSATARPLLVVAGSLTAMAMIAVAGIVGLRPFVGEVTPTASNAHAPPRSMLVGPAVLAVLGILMGLASPLVGTWLVAPAASAALGVPTSVKLVLWHGITPALLVTGISLAGGLIVYHQWENLHRLRPRMMGLADWTPSSIYERAMGGLSSRAKSLTSWLMDRSVLDHVAIVLAAFAGLTGTAVVGGFPTPFWRGVGLGSVAEVAVSGLIVLSALLVALTSSRLTSVIALGAVGYAIALLFGLFGAPDLAITQFLVETLAALLFLLALSRFPPYETRISGLGRLKAGALAATVGSAVFVVLLLAMGPPASDLVSGFYGAQSYATAHGRNVVNVILADFRALDTLGEVLVLGVAALGVKALLDITAGRSEP